MAHRMVSFRTVTWTARAGALPIDAAHRHVRRGQRARETPVILAAQTGIRELAPQGRVIAGPIGRGPPHRRAVLGTRIADGGRAEEVHQREKVLRAFVDLIRRDASEIRELAARLLTCLATDGVLGRLAMLDTTTGQQPRSGEWTAALTDEQDTSARIDARDDRADTSAHGVRVGLGVGVGAIVRPDGNGGSVSDGITNGVPLGFTVCPGVNAGEGEGEGEDDG